MIDKTKLQKIMKKLPRSKTAWQIMPYQNGVLAINVEHAPHVLMRGLLGIGFRWEKLQSTEIQQDDPMLQNYQAENRRRGLLSLGRPGRIDKSLTRK